MTAPRLTSQLAVAAGKPCLVDILRDSAFVEDVPVGEIPALLGRIEELRTRLLGRYFLATTAMGGRKEEGEDKLLTAEEAARALGSTKYYLYRHGKNLPFTVKLSPRQLRFSAKGIEKYKRQRQLG